MELNITQAYVHLYVHPINTLYLISEIICHNILDKFKLLAMFMLSLNKVELEDRFDRSKKIKPLIMRLQIVFF